MKNFAWYPVKEVMNFPRSNEECEVEEGENFISLWKSPEEQIYVAKNCRWEWNGYDWKCMKGFRSEFLDSLTKEEKNAFQWATKKYHEENPAENWEKCYFIEEGPFVGMYQG